MITGQQIAEKARGYETEAGHQIAYSEMVCNQFVLAVFKALGINLENRRADDFVNSPHFTKVNHKEMVEEGDLVHFPGHIAIVVDAKKGQFVGSQSSSGVATASYNSGYWSGEFHGKAPDYWLRFKG